MEPLNPALAPEDTELATLRNTGVVHEDAISTACQTCDHFIGLGFCLAFPKDDGIPAEILLGQNNHAEPLGDELFTWERRPDIKPEDIADQGDR